MAARKRRPGAATRPQPQSGQGRGLAFRLPGGVRPTDYRLHVHLDPEKGRSYRGEVEIDIEIDRPTSRFHLHSCELKIRSAKLRSGKPWTTASVRPYPDRETIEVRLESPLAAGKHTLLLRFSGKLRLDLRGLYFAETGGHRYAFTQLEAADARRFFPCFDEPAFKARFSLSVTTARAHTVISNAPEASVV